MEKKYTYEEAQTRKTELQEKINQYNIAYFNNEELPYTEEEITAMTEEFEFLYSKLGDQESEEEKEIKEKDKKFFDKVNPFLVIFTFFAGIFSIGFLNGLIGNAVFSGFKKLIFEITYKTEFVGLVKDVPVFLVGLYWLLSMLLIPFIFLIASLIIYKKLIKKNASLESVIFMKIVTYVLLILFVVVGIVMFFVYINPNLKAYSEIEYGYNQYAWDFILYVINKYGQDQASKFLALLGI